MLKDTGIYLQGQDLYPMWTVINQQGEQTTNGDAKTTDGIKSFSFMEESVLNTVWKVSIFGVLLVCFFPHLDWIQRDTEYLSVPNPNAGK